MIIKVIEYKFVKKKLYNLNNMKLHYLNLNKNLELPKILIGKHIFINDD